MPTLTADDLICMLVIVCGAAVIITAIIRG